MQHLRRPSNLSNEEKIFDVILKKKTKVNPKAHDERNINTPNKDGISNSAMAGHVGLYIDLYFKIFY